MTMIRSKEEQRQERDYEKILSYLRDQDIGELLEIIPNVFEVDIQDALINIILEYQLASISFDNEIVFNQ